MLDATSHINHCIASHSFAIWYTVLQPAVAAGYKAGSVSVMTLCGMTQAGTD